ncbi:MAG: hypothetical protein AB1449_11150, partial [Chloroflexota bacterium]
CGGRSSDLRPTSAGAQPVMEAGGMTPWHSIEPRRAAAELETLLEIESYKALAEARRQRAMVG